MKKTRHRKVLGIALGERSLLVAEVVGAEQMTVARTGELPYPAGVSPASAAALGAALSSFLSREGFSAKSAVIGLPARWLVTQPKEVPASDPHTLAEMLRLSAEAEFSTELKDLVYDFTGSGTSVLLVATPKRYVDAAIAMCEAAKINLDMVTATALSLGEATGRAAAKDVLVLSVGAGGSEITLQRDASSGALRHLRAPDPQAPFINELRRTVSTMPVSKGERELILWDDAGVDAKILSDLIGVRVRRGELPLLGISPSVNGNGANGQHHADENGQYATAVALGLQGISGDAAPVDFLHSRLAPPKQQRIPRWAMMAAAALVILVAGTIYAYHDLNTQAAAVDAMQVRYNGMKSRIDDATAFVSKVSFAQAWHGGDPRYLACIRDMTVAISEDFDTFAISLIIGDAQHAPNTPDTHALAGVLSGKAADQQHVLLLLNRLRKYPGFIDVTPAGSDAGRGREVTFQINFKYQAAKSAM